ncbi:MAG: hypothetical protein GQ540_06315 [Lutibacter sp.]|uniref:hypothetical protein n=1 Tax=Lutibacter sp. TaxID=1925666 RepID=UPI0019F39E0B|nr:hypothetical protein [Lutibacter sp.]NOR28126.1 hypothetical protein [Lutibacter sp.]
MKKVVYLSLLMGCSSLMAQNGDNLHREDKGSVIITKNLEIKGNDFIYDEWNRGMLVLNDSIFSKQDFLKFDVFKNRVFIKKNQEEIEIQDRSLSGFSIIEKERNLKHDFVKLNLSHFKSGIEDGFYEIVFNIQNTNYFIKKNTKILFDPNRSKGSQTINNFPLEYQDKTFYFIKNSEGLYVKVRLKKKDVKLVLVNHSKLIDGYMKSKKLKYNKESDVVKLVNYYYSL